MATYVSTIRKTDSIQVGDRLIMKCISKSAGYMEYDGTPVTVQKVHGGGKFYVLITGGPKKGTTGDWDIDLNNWDFDWDWDN